jgi:cytochrome c oxidase cbb3-type subunit 3/ubiquinol-cytochrome c reductase cytochrome c subunit
MIRRMFSFPLLACALALTVTGCNAPGKPKANDEAARPEQVTDFATLYGQNCAACHGEHGSNGAAISLSNPVYLAVAGPANLQRVIAGGVTGTLMPGFAQSAGGMLTDAQISILTQGMINTWGNPSALAGQTPPAYASTTAGDVSRGQKAFTASCARCHGADGTGMGDKNNPGPIVDPSYLALISDQGLRSIVIAGKPEQGMPDWRSAMKGDGAHPLSDQEITDIVAWLASHRVTAPGQPYQQHP